MTKKNYLILAIALFTLAGCASHAKTSSEKVIQDLFDKMLLYPSFVPDYLPAEGEELFTITAANLEGSVLQITIEAPVADQFSIDLRHNGSYMKSLPMKLNLFPYLQFVNPGSSKVKRTFRFELKELLPPGNTQLILRLKGYEGELILNRQ